MRTAFFLPVVLLLSAVLVVSCSPRAETPPTAPEPEARAGAPSVEQLWIDFCHYVVIASPELAVAFGQRLLDEASPQELRELMAHDDSTTRRAVRLLDESDLTAGHPELGDVWARLRDRARPDRTADR